MRIDNLYLKGKMFKNIHKSGFSPVRQDLSGKFGFLVLFSQETHMPIQVSNFVSQFYTECEFTQLRIMKIANLDVTDCVKSTFLIQPTI